MPEQVLASACPMDCPDTCSLHVTVQDGRVTEILPSPLNPTTRGFICSKVANFGKRLYSPDRILYPMKRTGAKGSGSFERISWDAAAEEISRRYHAIISEHGGEAILPFSYGGSNGLLAQDTADRAYFAKLGASRLARTVCAAPTGAVAKEMYGKMPGVAFEDYPNAKMILIWGANPKASNIHLVPFLKEAKKNGAFIAVVDPRLNFSSNEIDLHLPVYPGMDLPVALAMIRHWHTHSMLNMDFLRKHAVNLDPLLEAASAYTMEKAAAMARVPASDILRLAEVYAEAQPALIRCGWGLERNVNGGPAIAAILAMPALLGKFGVRGGGYTLSNSGAAKVDDNRLVDAPAWNTRIINMNLLGKVLLEENSPPVKALFVYNCNPAVTIPNQNAVIQGLLREDLFTVVSEQVMTDTARYADILLPATTFLEHEEIKKAYGSYSVHYSSGVIPAMGEAKPNQEVFALLGRSMGWDDTAFQMSTEDYLRRAASAMRGLGREITLESLKQNLIEFFDFPGQYPVQFETVFPWTADQKINLFPPAIGSYSVQDPKNGYPLAMISPSNTKMISSSLGEFNFPQLYVLINPVDASSRGITNGMNVRVFNDLGEVHCVAKIDRNICAGVVGVPKGGWCKSSLNGQVATALAPDTLGTAGGACFNDARVEVLPLPSA